MKMFRSQFIFIILAWFVKDLEARKIDKDLILRHSGAVNRRLAEVRQLLVPLPEDQWSELLHHLATLLVPVHAPSELCRNHSLHLLNSFLHQDLWALRMVDASSKLQSGLLDGNLHNLGSYAQCTSVTEPNQLFQGQHCVIETTGILPPEISDKISRKPLPFIDMDIMFSLCVPSSCTDEDILAHVDHSLAPLGVRAVSYLDQLGLTTDIKQISCSSAQGIPFRTKDYFAMIVFAFIASMVLLSSLLKVQSGWLSCFSLSENWKVLMDTEQTPGEISCLNGLRVLLAFSPMMVHHCFANVVTPSDRLLSYIQMYGSTFVGVVEFFALKSMDLFFLMGGCLLSYSFMLKNHKKANFDLVDICFKKYFRLTPVLAAVMLYQATLLVHSAHGPLWLRSVADYEDKCHCNWWAGLLHISDILVPHYMCVGESWFVACEFKLQCFALLFLPLLLRRPRLAISIITLCYLLSLAAAISAALYFQFTLGMIVALIFGDRMTDIHIPHFYRGTLFRAHSFLIGLIFGYFIFYCKQRKTPYYLSKRAAWLGWTLCCILFAGVITIAAEIVSPDHQHRPLFDPLFSYVACTLFCVCGAWIIFACHFGGGGIVNEILSWPGFRPLSRLGYSFYLCHVILQLIQTHSVEDPITPSWTNEIFLYLGYAVASYSVAVVMFTFVELPFYKLANHIMKGIQRNPKLKRT